MTSQEKYNGIINAYTTRKVDDGREEISIFRDEVNPEISKFLKNTQIGLDVTFDQSYEIVHEACDIIADLEIEKLAEADFFAEADSRANVYTSTQLSYLNNLNESVISECMKDESITSIAQACAIWRIEKVAEACEDLKVYILND